MSLAVHAVLLAVAGSVAWPRLELQPRTRPDYVWLGEWRAESAVVPPSSVAASIAPQPAAIRQDPVVERAVPEVAETPRIVEPAVPGPRMAPGSSPAPGLAPEALVRTPDWAEERRRAVEAVAERAARAGEFREPTVEQLLKPREREPYAVPERTIFDLGNRGGTSRGALSPGMARTKVGRVLSEFCSAFTGGFGFFGASVCARPQNRATGLYPEVLPEWLKLMPVCDQSKPVVDAYPTARCTLVRKEAEEPLSKR